MTTLADELPRQQERCRMILENALQIGQPGELLAMMLRASLKRAELAAISGDIVQMIYAIKELQQYSE
jgi:hypothetical protein